MLIFGAEIPLVELFAVFSITSVIILATAVSMMLIIYKQLRQTREILEAAGEMTPPPQARPQRPYSDRRPMPRGGDITFMKKSNKMLR